MLRTTGLFSVVFAIAVFLGGNGVKRADAGEALPSTVHARFDLTTLAGGPFPSDRFTVTDPDQNTSRRVSLPKPDCSARPSECQDLDVINTLDGFNVQPRLSIPFDGPIDPATVSSNTVFLVSLGNTLPPGGGNGEVIGINQVVWDPETNTLHVESDKLLDQHARYVLIVTSGVRDSAGVPTEASSQFTRFRYDRKLAQTYDPDLTEYQQALVNALNTAETAGVRLPDVVSASVFTTQSVTAVLEKIRDQIKAAPITPADFRLGPANTRTVFPLETVTGITFGQQTGVTPPAFTSASLNLALLKIVPNAVGQVAYGKFLSPDYQSEPAVMPAIGTRTGVPAVHSRTELFFTMVLPSGPRPAGGWPVAILGPGGGQNKNAYPLLVSATMAAHGLATIAINPVGHGFGPLSTLTVRQTDGSEITFSAGGRGLDQDSDGIISAREGDRAASPRTIIWERDGLRQTAVDLMQLVREIEVGMDVDGDSTADLNPSRIYYTGFSLGANYGTLFTVVEPNVQTGVLTVSGGPLIELLRLGPVRRPVFGEVLASRVPSLLNTPGITVLDGVTVPPPHYNENKPLRNQAPVTNTVAGAMPIQALMDTTEWVSQSGNSVAYAQHLRQTPLMGVPAKSIILQFAKGDQTSPNPANSALIRAANVADRVTFFRNDLALLEIPTLPKNPHGFMTRIDVPASAAIARGAQEQIAAFFASDGKEVLHPEPARFFEVPIQTPLPEILNFIP
jgi:hypothetical protein